MLQIQETYSIIPTCAERGKLGVEKYFAEQPTRPFGRLSSVYVFGEVLNAERGNILVSKWYAKSAEGVAPGGWIGSSEIKIDEEGSYDVSFCVQPPSQGWQPGEYGVEIYFNGLLAARHAFSVK